MPSRTGENVLLTIAESAGTEVLRTVSVDEDRAVVELTVSHVLLQPYGIVHGGVYAAAAEFTAQLAAQAWLDQHRPDGAKPRNARPTVVGTQFLRAVRNGILLIDAVPVHRGRSQQLWRVEITTTPPTTTPPTTTSSTGDDLDRTTVATAEVRLVNESP